MKGVERLDDNGAGRRKQGMGQPRAVCAHDGRGVSKQRDLFREREWVGIYYQKSFALQRAHDGIFVNDAPVGSSLTTHIQTLVLNCRAVATKLFPQGQQRPVRGRESPVSSEGGVSRERWKIKPIDLIATSRQLHQTHAVNSKQCQALALPIT